MRSSHVRTGASWLALAIAGALAASAAQAADLGSGPNPEQGIPIAGWMFYPQIFAGVVFNDNVNTSATHKQSGWGLRLTPSFQAYLDEGIYKTEFYGALDAQLYADHTSNNLVQGRVGIAETFQPTADFTANALFEYTRQNGLGGGIGGNVPLVLPSANSTLASAQTFNQFTGSLSIQKQLERFFIRPSVSAQAITYDNPSSSTVATYTGQDGVASAVALRGGYWVGPALYTFVEPSYQWHTYRRGGLNTQGYRIVGGLGSDQIGLFKGEVYGGYQYQSGASAIGGSVDSPVFGAKLFYYPTPYLNFVLSADETLGSSGGNSVASPATYTRGGVFQLASNYAFSPYWSAHARAAYAETSYLTGGRRDNSWIGGLGLSYTFWRNIALTADYQYSRLKSNVAFASYDQNLVTLGATYRY